MAVATIISAIIGAASGIGKSAASGAQEGDQKNESRALMLLNHKYAQRAEQERRAQKQAGASVASEAYGLNQADRLVGEQDKDQAENYSKGIRSQDRVLKTLNNNANVREQALRLFGGK